MSDSRVKAEEQCKEVLNALKSIRDFAGRSDLSVNDSVDDDSIFIDWKHESNHISCWCNGKWPIEILVCNEDRTKIKIENYANLDELNKIVF